MNKIVILGYCWKSQQNGAVYDVGGGIKHYHLSPEGQPRIGNIFLSMPRGSGLKRRNADGIFMVIKARSSLPAGLFLALTA